MLLEIAVGDAYGSGFEYAPCLINGLENGTFGRDYLIGLDRRLKNKFGVIKIEMGF